MPAFDRPVESSLNGRHGIVAGTGRPVFPFFDPLRDMNGTQFCDWKPRAESSSKECQVMLRLVVRSFGSIPVEPVKAGVEQVRNGFECGLGTATAANSLVVPLIRSRLVLAKVDLPLADLDVPGARQFTKEGLRFSHRLSLPSET